MDDESKEQLRMKLKSKIKASSLERMNNKGKQIELDNIKEKLKRKLGDDVDLDKMLQQIIKNSQTK